MQCCITNVNMLDIRQEPGLFCITSLSAKKQKGLLHAFKIFKAVFSLASLWPLAKGAKVCCWSVQCLQFASITPPKKLFEKFVFNEIDVASWKGFLKSLSAYILDLKKAADCVSVPPSLLSALSKINSRLQFINIILRPSTLDYIRCVSDSTKKLCGIASLINLIYCVKEGNVYSIALLQHVANIGIATACIFGQNEIQWSCEIISNTLGIVTLLQPGG